MNANLPATACDPNRLESFLNGDLSAAHEREFTLHLNTCEHCRLSLRQQAAEPEVWLEAEKLLKRTEFDSHDDGDASGACTAKGRARRPLQIQSVLDALAPTDDPAMLGRIGGYEVSGVVGAGGMGVVLKAIDKSLDRTVAIKVLAPHLAASGAARKRFAREAKAAAAVLHHNVIAIHSVSNDEALPYLVMPYLRGTSLQKRLDDEGPLSLQEILRIGSQIAAGLAAAHAQGLVHRDIKPANILLEQGVERVAITDFGLARAVDDGTITHSGVIAGTPQYMSPEQARGEAVDGRSDLFSLGSVLYAIATGRPPFRAETSYGVMRRITDDESTPIREINPEIPDWLCSIIGKLMAKQAGDRFESAAEVTKLLEECLAHVQQPAAVPLPHIPSAITAQAASQKKRPTISYRKGVIAMIAAFGFLGMALWLSADPPDISGRWTGEGWGEVVLEQKQDGAYGGTYTDTFGKEAGGLELKWSRTERRFKGTWREGKERFGAIAVRLVGDEIRGAWTTNEGSRIQPGNPELADLLWTRSSEMKVRQAGREITKPEKPSVGDPVNAVDLPPGVLTASQVVEQGNALYHSRKKVTVRFRVESAANVTQVDERGKESKRWNLSSKAASDWVDPTAFSVSLSPEAWAALIRRGIHNVARHYVGRVIEVEGAVQGVGLDIISQPTIWTYHIDVNSLDQIREVPPEQPKISAAQSGRVKHAATGGDAGAEARGFSEPKEVVLSMDGMKFMLDLDTGKTMPPQAKVGNPEQGQMDLHTDQVQPYHYPTKLIGVGLVGREVKSSDWDASVADVRKSLTFDGGIGPLKEMDLGPEKNPTYFFKTRDGAYGILQLMELVHEPKGIRIRYKTVETDPDRLATKMTAGGPKLRHRIPASDSVESIACSADGKLIAIANGIVTDAAASHWNRLVVIVDAETAKTVAVIPITSKEEEAIFEAPQELPHFEALAFSNDGNVVAVGTTVGQVKLFNARTGELLRSLDDEQARRADKQTPEKLKSLARAMGSVASLAFSPDGSLLATCGKSFDEAPLVSDGIERGGLPVTGPGRLKVWDVKTGTLKHDLEGHAQVYAVALSADGGLLASAGNWSGHDHGTGVITWNPQTGKKIGTMVKEANGGVHAVTFSPTKKMVAIGARLYDKENDTYSTAISVAYPMSGITEWQQTIPGHAHPKAFTPDGTSIAVLCGGKSIRFIDVETGKVKHEIKLADAPDGGKWSDFAIAAKAGVLVIGRDDGQRRGSVEVWDLAAAAESEPQPKASSDMPRRLHDFQTDERVESIAVSADGKRMAIANGNPTRILQTDGTSRVKDNWKPSVRIMGAVPDFGERTFVSLSPTTPEEDAVLAATPRISHVEATALAFSQDGSLLVVGTSIGQVKLFETKTGELVRALDDEAPRLADRETPESWKSMKRAMGSVASLAFSPDGSLLAVCGTSFGEYSDIFDGVESLGRLATGPGRLKVFEVKPGRLKHDLAGHSHVYDVAFSADGTLLASAGRWGGNEGNGTGVITWNTESGTKVTAMAKEVNVGVHRVTFSPTRKMIAIGAGQYDKENDTYSTSISVAFPMSGITQWQQSIPGHAQPKAFAPDGTTVAVLCGGESIRFIDVGTGQLKHEIKAADWTKGGRWSDFGIATKAGVMVIGRADGEHKGSVEIWEFNGGGDAEPAADPATVKEGKR